MTNRDPIMLVLVLGALFFTAINVYAYVLTGLTISLVAAVVCAVGAGYWFGVWLGSR